MFRKKYFSEALELARSVKGLTSPNPAVGSIVVKRGVILGKGATQPPGGMHAEVAALTEAGHAAAGGELYVTLEPCVDFPGKRTPSCAGAIIRAGIRKVYYGSLDPNPLVCGKGCSELRGMGVEVERIPGFERGLEELNEDYFKFILTGTPFVTAKYAMTLDGNIATLSGDSKWISGEKSRERAHELRNRSDAILVGVGTVIADDPKLNVRIPSKRHDPLRIVIDPDGRTPPASQVLSDELPTLFVVSEKIPDSFAKLCAGRAKKLLRVRFPLDYPALLATLAKDFGVMSLLIEGGGRTLYAALQAGIVDKAAVFIAPKILGGKGIQPFEGETTRNMQNALKLNRISVENIEEDIFLQGYLHESGTGETIFRER